MRSIAFFLGFSFLSLLSCKAQDHPALKNLHTDNNRAERKFKNAFEHFRNKENADAIKDANKAIDIDPEFLEPYELLGIIYEGKKRYKIALQHYEKVKELDPRYSPSTYYKLGVLNFKLQEYEAAEGYLKDYLDYPAKKKAFEQKARKLKESAVFAKKAVKNPVPYNPQNLGPKINSEHDEYLPTITADEQTLIITRRGPSDKQTRGRGNRREEDFFVSHKKNGEWTQVENIGPPINTPYNEGAQCISPDGQFLFYTACNRPDGMGSCDLFYSRKVGNRWSPPRNMGRKVNSRDWDSQPTISADGKTLYFSSSRGGGGNKDTDIWKTVLTQDKGWSEPVKVSSLSTPFNDRSPFIHPDGKTMYFSSNGYPGMGGMDLYVARMKEDGSFHKIQNLGYPINTRGDETSLIVSTDGKTAYFATSDREDVIGQIDLYSFELHERVRPDRVTYAKGVVYDKETGDRLQARCELIDLETDKTVTEVYSRKRSGEFLVCLPPGKDYGLNVARPGYLFFSENFSLKDTLKLHEPYEVDAPLEPIKKGASVVLNNVFFETAKYDLKKISKTELMKLVEFMESNPSIKVRIEGHTDSIGTDEDNQVLSQNRAESVQNFLVRNGIAKERLSYKGFGEEKPVASNSTSEGRARNRRTEFRIMEK